MNIGNIIKHQRKNVIGLTQKELSDKAGITQAQISQIESGVSDNITIDNLRRIAKAMKCAVIDLLRRRTKNHIKKKCGIDHISLICFKFYHIKCVALLVD